MTTSFIHLKVHSAYSLAEGAIKVSKLVDLCAAQKMPAVAITDTNNLFGALEFSLSCIEKGVQPIIGCKLRFKRELPNGADFSSLVLLAQTETGYKNLMKLVSDAYLEAKEIEAPCLPFQALEDHHAGLIVLSGAMEGLINQSLLKKQEGVAREHALWLKNLLGDRFYLEITRLGYPEEAEIEEALLDLAYALNIPFVATNEVYFATSAMHEAHSILLGISEGVTLSVDNRRRLTAEHYFKSSAEMSDLFKDLPEALANSVIIAQRCCFMPKSEKPILPPFPTASGRSEVEELREKTIQGLEERLKNQVYSEEQPEEEKEALRQTYFSRLEYEVEIIEKMGFCGYFLIVSDFIQWAKHQGIPVGPGRGSGAGSLVAWSLTITDIDPIKFNLIFERFLNPERVSMPDFDIDFCQDRRDEVIRYVREKYGHDRVAHIITFGKLQARAVLRDVGRVLEMPYGQVDKICKLVPNNPANPITLEQALDLDPHLRQQMIDDPTVNKLIDIGLKLEGLYRHASTHAAGVVIGDRPLHQLVPLYLDPRSPLPATQFNMKYVEQAGLMKFDFLGLKTLTVIQKACELVAETQGTPLEIDRIPLTNKTTFALLNRVETVGVFQLESAGMRDVLRRLKPDRFEELIALVALYRPGPMDDIPRYLACKHGEEQVQYLHPMLEPILQESFGVMVVQEQVMQIAQVMAGYTLGGADLLRRAMGKKNREEMNAQRLKFVDGAKERGVREDIAEAVFEQMSKFAGYGFNKSHAAPYALLTYQTAYLKANYPVEFLCASMTLDLNNIDKINLYRQELKRYGIPLLGPDINASTADFAIEDVGEQKGVRYALAAIKNVGMTAMEMVVEERRKGGAYKDILDFVRRMDNRVLNKRQLENLIQAGAFDVLHPCRRTLWQMLDAILQSGRMEVDSRPKLFEDLDEGPALDLNGGREWSPLEKLQREFDALGFYLSSHPLEGYPLEALGVVASNAFIEVFQQGEGVFKAAGVMISSKERSTKSGQKYAFVQMTDAAGQYEVVMFSEVLNRTRDFLLAGRAFLMTLSGRLEGEEMRLTVQSLEALEHAASASPIDIYVQRQETITEVQKILAPVQAGPVSIRLILPLEDGTAYIKLPGGYQVSFEERVHLQHLSETKQKFAVAAFSSLKKCS